MAEVKALDLSRLPGKTMYLSTNDLMKEQQEGNQQLFRTAVDPVGRSRFTQWGTIWDPSPDQQNQGAKRAKDLAKSSPQPMSDRFPEIIRFQVHLWSPIDCTRPGYPLLFINQ